MHRSGTSLLTQLLMESGLFMGVNLTKNQECRFMNAINSWVFKQASATWDRPESVDWLLNDPTIQSPINSYMDGLVSGIASSRFLGLTKWLRYRSLHKMNQPWGWKDPKNTWTLPLWLKVFPRAQVLHIFRHGVPVSESLKVRREQAINKRINRFNRWKSYYINNPFGLKKEGFGEQPLCQSLQGSFSIWEQYISRAYQSTQLLQDRVLHIRYETLLDQPQSTLDSVLEFSRLPIHQKALNKAVKALDKSRSQDWRNDPELTQLAKQKHQLLTRYGYSD